MFFNSGVNSFFRFPFFLDLRRGIVLLDHCYSEHSSDTRVVLSLYYNLINVKGSVSLNLLLLIHLITTRNKLGIGASRDREKWHKKLIQ